ncbi:MAG: cell surface protein SprA [Balneolaceae bacterium]
MYFKRRRIIESVAGMLFCLLCSASGALSAHELPDGTPDLNLTAQELGERAPDLNRSPEKAAADTTDNVYGPAFGLPQAARFVSRPYLKPYPRLYHIGVPGEAVTIERLPGGRYLAVQTIGEIPVRLPGVYPFSEYADLTRREDMRSIRRELIGESAMAEGENRGLLDFRFTVPGGRESAFTTIFGRPEVNLRVNGMANMNAGATIQKTSDPSLPPDQQTRVDPTFGQNLQLNIQGTIGDKLTVQTDWDTERTFDYQNLLSIAYEGYEDEIIQRVEMGNVSMQTGNSLIRGSGSLFGIKSVARLGSLRLTSVLSQQKGESNTETITGGAQERRVSLRPADYENNRHFFLDYYTRQEFEQSMSNPQQLLQTLQISEVNIWVLREQVQTEEGSRPAVALTDYGVVENPDGTYSPPDNEADRFDRNVIDSLRDPSVGISAIDLGLDDPADFEEGYFELLTEGADYTVNTVTGYISLNRSLSSREVLAVSFTYLGVDGRTVSVGDVNPGGGDRIFLKMLRPGTVSTDHAAFPLTMRNVYSLGAADLTRDNIDLELQFTEGNVEQNRLPGRFTTLLQDLGLDRVDSQGAPGPDNQVDFGTGTLDARNGRLIFPYLEPFGSRLEDLLLEAGTPAEEVDRLVFDQLYEERRQNASRLSENNFYRFDGLVKGGVQENFTLDVALVEGSVRVYANGSELQEGIDYQVDYSFGSISILNDRYTAPGQEIRIEYENQALTTIEQKTFTGLRAEYELGNDIRLGGTYFRYNERPLDDKIRIGDEPISNMVFGLDANARFNTPFITEALDAVPFLSTREPSEVSFSGEFAQLRPGISETSAVDRAIRNNELHADEQEGLSFLDDFEGSSIKINLMNPARWFLPSAPAAVPGYSADEIYFEEDVTAPSGSPRDVQADRSDLRSGFSWYSIPRNISNILEGVEYTPESQPVRVTDVFPGRETRNPQDEIVTTLDVHYDPTSRGPYNYNMDLRRLLENEPERTWGGMTAVLPSGQEDFSQNNVEFIEFWVQPILPGGRDPMAGDMENYDGRIYIDVGVISEDVVPNAKLNTEDGLALNPASLAPDSPGDPRSYLPSNPAPPEGQFSTENRDLEDVGLDGLPSSGGYNGLNERSVFSGFIDAMEADYGRNSPEFQSVFSDPSNDSYAFYGESSVEDLPLHERFYRMMSHYEGNTPVDQGDRRAVTNRPNTEGLVNPSRVELNNAYFQYELEFNPADFAALAAGEEGTFIVDRVSGTRQEDRWYQVRIPMDEFARQAGEIEDFQNISYVRIWMSGYSQPFTLRFATLDFVGSQWQHAESVNEASDPSADMKVSTVNIEENSSRRPVPYRQPVGAIRARERGTQMQSLQNEQAIVLDVENLGPGGVQLVRRNFPGGLNLLNYSNMRMFVHGEGYDSRDEAELVMRFGNDLDNSYYEYRQPVSPTDVGFPFQDYDPGQGARLEEEADQVWLYDENSMNIILRAFNQLKQLRDQEAPEDVSRLFERNNLLDEAAPGAVIAIRGNPSLDRVNEIGMGIRNPYDPDDPSGPGSPVLNAQFWLNELRVSGFDNEPGWAANAKSSFKLADVATLSTSLTRQTAGFGALNSRLGERRVSDQLAYDVSSTVYMHRFLPERYGWSIPVNLTTRRSELTPRFLPNEGDIRLSDFRESVRSREDLTVSQQELLIERRIREVQSVTESYAVNLSNISKNDSRSRLTRFTLDNTTFNYVYNTSNTRNPQYRFQDNRNFNTSIRYNIDFPAVRYMRPLGFMENLPLVHVFSGLGIGMIPNNFTSSFRMNRMYEERRRRIFDQAQPDQPLQQTHNFNYNTTVGFGYNLTRSVTTNFQAQGGFDLSRAGQRDAGLTGSDSTAFDIIPSFTVLERLITDPEVQPRRSTYQEDYTASWQPRFDQLRPVSWVNYTLRYGGGYRWENTPFDSNLGARVSNTLRLDHNLRLEVGNLLDRWEFFSRLKDAGRPAGPAGSLQQADGQQEADGASAEGFLLPAGRGLLAGILSFQSIEISYNDAKSGSQAGYSGGSQLTDLFGGSGRFSPPFLYRLGYAERINESRLIDNPDGLSPIQLPANNSFSDNVNLQTRMLPFNNFSIDLTWTVQWDERVSRSLSIDPDDRLSSVRNASGNAGSSVWSFGSGYRDLFERQLETAFDGISASSDSISSVDGRTVLNRETLQEDFRKAYLAGGGSTVGERNFTPFPLPSWRINWMGIEEFLPFVGQFMERASLTHAYSGMYRLGWTYNSNPGPVPFRRIGAYAVDDERPEFEPASVNIEKRFAPLLQLNVTWDRNLRTQVGYEYSKLTSMSLSSINVTERTSRGVTMSMTYTFRNFKIPFFRELSNNLDVTLSGNLIDDTEQRFMLDSDIDRALSEGHETIVKNPGMYDISPRAPSGQTRMHVSSIFGYRFSSTLQANIEYAFSRTLPKSSRTFERTTHDIRFSMRINFRSG